MIPPSSLSKRPPPASGPDATKRARLPTPVLNSAHSHTAKVTSDKQVESGFLPSLGVLDAILCFEGVPIWLPSLDPKFIRFIYIPQFRSWSHFQHFLLTTLPGNKIFSHCVTRLTPTCFHFGSSPSPSDFPTLRLLSGSLPYILKLADTLSHSPTISILNVHVKCRKIPSAPVPLSCITHKQVGGVTSFETLYFLQGINYPPALTSLRRKVNAVIDYSISPSVCLKDPADSTHLSEYHILPFHSLDTFIAYNSSFCASGIGARSLTSPELHVAFGLPSCYHSLSLSVDHFHCLVPLQILDALLLPAIRALSNISLPEIVPRLQLSPPAPHTDAVFLPSINKILPGGWKKFDQQSQLSAKADDAEVNEYLWNGRVSSLYPSFTSSVLGKLRHLVVRRQKYHPFLELSQFLRSKHSNVYAFFRSFGRKRLLQSQ